MTSKEMIDFIYSVTWEDCTIRLYDKVYYCLALTVYPKENEFEMRVFEINPVAHEWIRDLLVCTSDSKDDCMKHFLEDKYWDGKSFYEVAPDMEWIDL